VLYRPECAKNVPGASATGTATRVSYVGTYPPGGYLPSAVGIRVGEALGLGLPGITRSARAFGAIFDLALVAAAGALLLRRRAATPVLTGLVLAATPFAAFTFAQVSGSGMEIAAAFCFTAGLLRLTDDADRGERSRSLVWAAVAMAGFLFAISRSTGPYWCVAAVFAVAVFRPRPAWRAVRRRPVAAAATAALLAVGGLSTVLWEAAYEPPAQTTLRQAFANLPFAWHRLGFVLEQVIGRLGWLNRPLDPGLIRLWWLLILGALAVAVVVASWAERAVLLALPVAVLGMELAIDVLLIQPASRGFDMQARYVYAPFLLIPLFAADVLRRRARGWLTTPYARAAQCAVALLVIDNLVRAVNENAGYYRRKAFYRPSFGWPTWDWIGVLAVVLGVVGAVLLYFARESVGSAEPRAVTAGDAAPATASEARPPATTPRTFRRPSSGERPARRLRDLRSRSAQRTR
jgi:hypothetical protein